MKIKSWIVLLAAGCVAGLCNVAIAEQVVMNDGSRIQGKILSLEHGIYTVQTNSMGVIRLKQDEINSISHGTAAPAVSADNALQPYQAETGQSAVQSLQSSLASNPGMMTNIMALQNDPDMQAVLSDPEVMRAVQNFDLETLRNHPKIRKLMQNQTIQDIQEEVP